MAFSFKEKKNFSRRSLEFLIIQFSCKIFFSFIILIFSSLALRHPSSVIFAHFGLLKNHGGQNRPNLDVILFLWFSYKIVYGDLAVHPRWLPWPSLLIDWKIGNLWKSSSEPLDGLKPNSVNKKQQTKNPWVVSFQNCQSIIQDGCNGRLCNFWFSSIILSFWHTIQLMYQIEITFRLIKYSSGLIWKYPSNMVQELCPLIVHKNDF